MTLEADLAAASDPSTSAEELARLASSTSAEVRRAVAENMATPKEALARLFKEFPDLVLSNPASAYFELGEGTLAWIPLEDRVSVARHGETSVFVLCRLAADADWGVRYVVVQNANTPPAALRSLAADASADVRSCVAYHANTPVDVLCLLAKDATWFVRSWVARNANTPQAMLRVLVIDPEKEVRKIAKARLRK